MSKSYVEIDFFKMERQNNASSKLSSPERAPSSFRGIQSVVSRINPQLLKTVMAGRGAAGPARSPDNTSTGPASSNPSSPSRTTAAPPFPVGNPASRCSSPAADSTAPLTIFYNGAVITVDVPRDKAEAIMRMAETGVAGSPPERPEEYCLLDGIQLEEGLPIARRKSLRRFLAKRKDRFACSSPYHNLASASLPMRRSLES